MHDTIIYLPQNLAKEDRKVFVNEVPLSSVSTSTPCHLSHTHTHTHSISHDKANTYLLVAMSAVPSKVNNHIACTMVKLSSPLSHNQTLGGCQKQVQFNTPTASPVEEKPVTLWAPVFVIF